MADRVRTAVPGPMAVRGENGGRGETEVSAEMGKPEGDGSAGADGGDGGNGGLGGSGGNGGNGGVRRGSQGRRQWREWGERRYWGEMAEMVEMVGMAGAMVMMVAQGGAEGMVAAGEVTAVREVTVVTEEMAATQFNHALISLLSWQQAYKTARTAIITG